MPEIPAPVNPEAKAVDDAIHAAVFDIALEGYRKEAVALFPWLAFPVISQIFGLFTKSIAERFYQELSKFAVIRVIEAQTDREKADYRSAVVGLHVAQGSPDPLVREKAEERFRETLRRLVQFEGVERAAK